MTDKINDGGPAFPLGAEYAGYAPEFGMSMRDYFAARALPVSAALWIEAAEKDGMDTDFQAEHNYVPSDFCRLIARDAYLMADAMLAAREVKHD